MMVVLVACGDGGERGAAVRDAEAHDQVSRPSPAADVVALSDLPPLGGGDVAREVVGAAIAFGDEHADHFAGLMVAQGYVWAGFTIDAEGHLTALRSRLPPRAPVRAFRARYTERELRALQAEISADIPRLREDRVRVSSVGVSVRHNRVEITIADDDARAVELLRQRYGDEKVVVTPGVVVRPVAR